MGAALGPWVQQPQVPVELYRAEGMKAAGAAIVAPHRA